MKGVTPEVETPGWTQLSSETPAASSGKWGLSSDLRMKPGLNGGQRGWHTHTAGQNILSQPAPTASQVAPEATTW